MSGHAGRAQLVTLAALVVANGGALTFLALTPAFTTAELFAAGGLAFVCYAAAAALAPRSPVPAWGWFLVGLAIRLPWLGATPTLSDDMWRYLHDGRAQLAGVNPYQFAPAEPAAAAYAGPEHSLINHPELRTIYPPTAQLAFRLAAFADGGVVAWKLLVLLCDLGIGLAVLRIVRRRGLPAGAVAAYLLHPLPVIEFIGNGHLDAVAIVLLLLGIAALPSGLLGGAALACSIAAKYVTLPLVPFAAQAARDRARAWFFAGTAAALLLVYLPFLDYPPFGSLVTYLRTWEFNGSLYPIAAALTSRTTARWVAVAVLAGLLGYLWASRADLERAAFLWLAALFLVSPVVHPWYLTWLVPFLAWRREPWALLWSGTVLLSYAVLPGWQQRGVWELPRWAAFAEYVPVWGLLLWQLAGWIAPMARPRAPSPAFAGPEQKAHR